MSCQSSAVKWGTHWPIPTWFHRRREISNILSSYKFKIKSYVGKTDPFSISNKQKTAIAQPLPHIHSGYTQTHSTLSPSLPYLWKNAQLLSRTTVGNKQPCVLLAAQAVSKASVGTASTGRDSKQQRLWWEVGTLETLGLEGLQVLQELRGPEGTREHEPVGKQTLSILPFKKQHTTKWIILILRSSTEVSFIISCWTQRINKVQTDWFKHQPAAKWANSAACAQRQVRSVHQARGKGAELSPGTQATGDKASRHSENSLQMLGDLLLSSDG